MSHKSTENENTKNNVFTPDDVETALANLPFNYIKKAQERLGEKVFRGKTYPKYSQNWIVKVKKGEAFNEEILEVITRIGLENHQAKSRFASIGKKKTPSAH